MLITVYILAGIQPTVLKNAKEIINIIPMGTVVSTDSFLVPIKCFILKKVGLSGASAQHDFKSAIGDHLINCAG